MGQLRNVGGLIIEKGWFSCSRIRKSCAVHLLDEELKRNGLETGGTPFNKYINQTGEFVNVFDRERDNENSAM